MYMEVVSFSLPFCRCISLTWPFPFFFTKMCFSSSCLAPQLPDRVQVNVCRLETSRFLLNLDKSAFEIWFIRINHWPIVPTFRMIF